MSILYSAHAHCYWTLSVLIRGIVVSARYWAETWSGGRDMLYGSGSHSGSLSPFIFVYRSPQILYLGGTLRYCSGPTVLGGALAHTPVQLVI